MKCILGIFIVCVVLTVNALVLEEVENGEVSESFVRQNKDACDPKMCNVRCLRLAKGNGRCTNGKCECYKY